MYNNLYASKINPDERTNERLRAAFDVATNDDLLNCTIPRNDDGLPDISMIADPPSFIAAIIADTARLVAEEAHGGDDSFFDYLPDGIDQLQYLYSCVDVGFERFNNFMKAYIDFVKVTGVDSPDDIDDEYGWVEANNRTLLGPDHAHIAFMDCTSPLVQYIA